MVQLPADAQAVVVGGGVAGCSIAFHLARLGWQDVVLLERHDLTEGTTWHSAGFVGQLRSTVTQTRMIMYSAGLYPELRDLTGLDPGWHGVGGLRLATTPERHEELLRQAGAAETYGLDMDLLDASATHDLLPLLAVDDVLSSLWLPGDGWLDPARLGRALAEGARKLGVRIVTGVEVTGLDVENGHIRGVKVRASAVGEPESSVRESAGGDSHGRGSGADGPHASVSRSPEGPAAGGRAELSPGEQWVIRTGTVVNAAGAAAGVVGRMAGVDVPIVPIKHQYVVTAPSGVPVTAPTVRDPDNIVYFREEGGGILVGGYIRTPDVWDDPNPLSRPRALFPPNMPKFEESWESARRRLPSLRTDGEIVKVVHGPEAFTPDGEFLLGETSVRGFWVAAGFCVHGLAAAGGVGKVMAEWIVDGQPEYDMFGMDIARFGSHARSRKWARAKALDSYSKYYDIAYPGEERTAARPLRRSPAWVRHAELGAEFGEKAGWERVNWYDLPEFLRGSSSERHSDSAGVAAGETSSLQASSLLASSLHASSDRDAPDQISAEPLVSDASGEATEGARERSSGFRPGGWAGR
ncbi:FAD-dependent oxidoreductase, partial [Acrocarpospora corrugata]